MQVCWFSHLKDEEAKRKFKEFVKSSYPVLDRLDDIIKDKLDNVKVFGSVDYKDASWAYMAADRNGYIRALEEISDLLNNDEGKTNDQRSKRSK